jgi:lysophospholipase L1-like esterase
MRRSWMTLCVLTLAATTTRADDAFFFKKGDRIVFLGDSITEQYQYSSYIELYLTTRFPDWDLTFINAGIGGDTATGGANRFKAHVLDEKPTCVTIDFGMNDGGYGAFDKARNAGYVKGTTAMLEAAKKAGVRVALISPNAVDRRKGKNFPVYLETQKQFYEPLKGLAQKYEVSFVDQYAVTRAVLEKAEETDPKAEKVNPFPDGVHTAPSGGLLMAHTILTGLHAPAKVSDVSIILDKPKAATDGIGKPMAKTERCTVENLQAGRDGVSFDRIDEALPVPVHKDWLALLPYVNELKDLNYYGLTVDGLAEGKYALSIDGKEVGTFTSKDLADGVNLGNLTVGPIYDQAQKVNSAIGAKNDIVHRRFRGVVMSNVNFPDWARDLGQQFAARRSEELKKRMDEISGRQMEIYKLAKPAKHTFKLEPAKGE